MTTKTVARTQKQNGKTAAPSAQDPVSDTITRLQRDDALRSLGYVVDNLVELRVLLIDLAITVHRHDNEDTDAIDAMEHLRGAEHAVHDAIRMLEPDPAFEELARRELTRGAEAEVKRSEP